MMKGDSKSGEKQPHRDSKKDGKRRTGRPKGSGEKPEYANIKMRKSIMRKLQEHDRPNEYLDSLLRRACDRIIIRIQTGGHALLGMLSMTAAGCSVALVSLYMAIHA